MTYRTENVPVGVLNADPRLFTDDQIPELVRDLVRLLASEQGVHTEPRK